jgi:multimeric flavodoxin WrbA
VINKILQGAKEQGAETQCWYLSDLNIKPCCSCYGCKNGDKGCVVSDDMQILYSAILNSEVLVFGSPVYIGQMSAQAKIFTDRLYAFFLLAVLHILKKNGLKKRWS